MVKKIHIQHIRSLHFFCLQHLVPKTIFSGPHSVSMYSIFKGLTSSISSLNISEQKSRYSIGSWRKHKLLYK